METYLQVSLSPLEWKLHEGRECLIPTGLSQGIVYYVGLNMFNWAELTSKYSLSTCDASDSLE